MENKFVRAGEVIQLPKNAVIIIAEEDEVKACLAAHAEPSCLGQMALAGAVLSHWEQAMRHASDPPVSTPCEVPQVSHWEIIGPGSNGLQAIGYLGNRAEQFHKAVRHALQLHMPLYAVLDNGQKVEVPLIRE